MKKIIIALLVISMVFGMAACGKSAEEKVQEKIEEAVEEAIEEGLEMVAEDEEDEDIDIDIEFEEGSDEKSGSITVGDATYEYSGEEIPEDFPYDVCPLYESDDAEVVGVVNLTSDETNTYSLEVLTNKDIKDVNTEVKESLIEIYDESDIQSLSMGTDNYMYMMQSDDWSVTVSVVSGEEADHVTMISYIVVSK